MQLSVFFHGHKGSRKKENHDIIMHKQFFLMAIPLRSLGVKGCAIKECLNFFSEGEVPTAIKLEGGGVGCVICSLVSLEHF